GGFRRLGSTVRVVLQESRGVTMVLHEEISLSVPITLVVDGSPLGEKALEVAIRLSKMRELSPYILILAQDKDSAYRLQESVQEQLAKEGLSGRFRTLVKPSLASLTWWLETEARGPVVLPCSGELLQGEALCTLVDRISNPVVLVR